MHDYLPFDVLLPDPIKTALKVGLLVLLGFILGLIVPGLLYYQLGTFSDDDVIQYLQNKIQN
jgi:hypothetical protein